MISIIRIERVLSFKAWYSCIVMLNDLDVKVVEPNFEEIQKWILQSVNDDLEDMLADLQGKVWTVDDDKAEFKIDPTREKLINDIGVSRIRGIFKRYITRSSMLGNIHDYEYEQIMMSFVTVIIREIGDNKENWNIPEGAEDSIVDTTVDFIMIVLTRARGGLDRGLFNKITTTVQRVVKGDEKDKAYVPSPMGQGVQQ